MSYHSTGIRRSLDHCPAALDYHERGDIELDRRGFEVGIAAHAVLEAVGRETEAKDRELEAGEVEAVGNAVSDALIKEGREFDGRPEPPLNPDSVFAGRDLAEEWLTVYPIQPTGAHYEVGLAVDREWNPVPYFSGEAWIAAIVDVAAVEEVEDEESLSRVLRIRDYKTAWSADAKELGSLQRKIQACLAFACLPEASDADILRLEVAAVRIWKVYTDEIHLPYGKSKLTRWRRDISAVVGDLDALAFAGNGVRPARPGAGCVGCPFLHKCPDAQLYFNATGLPDKRKELAKAYAIASAMQDDLKPRVQEAANNGAIRLDDGSWIGFRSTESDTPTDDAHETLARLWCEATGHEELSSYMSSAFKSLGPLSVKSIKAMVKSIYPRKEDKLLREVTQESLTTQYKRRNWTIWKEDAQP